MNKSLIPKGVYCYQFQTEVCPYFSVRERNGVFVPWCLFLNKGGLPNVEDKEMDKILAYYNGDEQKMNEELPLSLLFDMVKECGENYD